MTARRRLRGTQRLAIKSSAHGIRSTAERLGTDSPALQGSTLTLDALVARANIGSIQVDADTTIILDEAGMVDHNAWTSSPSW